jgi:hypothetical protein
MGANEGQAMAVVAIFSTVATLVAAFSVAVWFGIDLDRSS